MHLDEGKRRGRAASKAWRQGIGAAVRRAREAKGYSQQDLADLVGADLGTISDIELGGADPRISTLWTIAEKIGIGLDDLVGRDASAWTMPPENGADGTPGQSPSRDPWLAIEGMQRQLDDLTSLLRQAGARPESPTKPTPPRTRTA